MNAISAIASPLTMVSSRAIGREMMFATNGPQTTPNTRYPVMRGSLMRSNRSPASAAAISANPNANPMLRGSLPLPP